MPRQIVPGRVAGGWLYGGQLFGYKHIPCKLVAHVLNLDLINVLNGWPEPKPSTHNRDNVSTLTILKPITEMQQ